MFSLQDKVSTVCPVANSSVGLCAHGGVLVCSCVGMVVWWYVGVLVCVLCSSYVFYVFVC